MTLTGPGDLVIEILSPATEEYDLGKKRDAYAEGGVPEYWMIDLLEKRLLVDRPAGTRCLEIRDERVETPALPGFWLEAKWLWAEPLPNPATCLEQIRGSEP